MAFFHEDLDAFFDVDEFAVTVTVGASTVPMIFDRAHIEALGGYAGGIDATQPLCLARSVDVVAHGIHAGSEIALPASGEAFWGAQEWWGGSRFTVNSLRPDGTGITVLGLEVVG